MAVARVAFFAISMVLLSSVATATDFIVGDEKGWTVDVNYTQWAQDKVFHVGDNLVFKYDNTKHNVLKVNGTLFKDCTIPPSNEALALSSGKDVIPLQAPGKKWYICGFPNHCANRNMKLVINVFSDGPAPAPSSAPHSLLSSLSAVLVSAVVAVGAVFA